MHYLLAISLSILSYLFFTLVDRYSIDGEQLLNNPDFSNQMDGWKIGGKRGLVEGSEGTVKITHDSSTQSNSLSQCWPRSGFPDLVLVGIEAKSVGLVTGPKSWHEARAGFVGHLPDGRKNYRLSSRVLSLKEDSPWKRYQVGLKISPKFERVCFVVALFQTEGQFQIKNPSIYPAAERFGSSIVSMLLLSLWPIIGIWWLVLLVKHYRKRPQLGYLLVMLLLMAIGILMPPELKTVLERALFSQIPDILTKDILSALGIPLDRLPAFVPAYWSASKLGHLLGFALLSMILFSDRDKPVWILLAGLVLATLVTELLQYFVPGRSPRIGDAIIDFIGIVIGLSLIRFSFWIRQSVSGRL